MSIYNHITCEFSGKVRLEIISKDRNGLVGDITTQPAEMGIRILNHKAITYKDDKNKSMSKLIMTVEINENTLLDSLLHRLNKIQGVVSVHCSAA